MVVWGFVYVKGFNNLFPYVFSRMDRLSHGGLDSEGNYFDSRRKLIYELTPRQHLGMVEICFWKYI